jgi:hypothetical protein
MKVINEQIQHLRNMELLIKMMESEIDLMRNITYRYYLKHGHFVKEGDVNVPNELSFSLMRDGITVRCGLVNSEDIRLYSNYELIKSEINRLK